MVQEAEKSMSGTEGFGVWWEFTSCFTSSCLLSVASGGGRDTELSGISFKRTLIQYEVSDLMTQLPIKFSHLLISSYWWLEIWHTHFGETQIIYSIGLKKSYLNDSALSVFHITKSFSQEMIKLKTLTENSS